MAPSAWIPALSIFLAFQGSQGGVHQRQLLKELMEDYTPLERPVGDDAQPITVHFTLSLMQIMDVDEKNQVLTTNVWLQMYWYDHYLRWNETEYPGVKTLRFSADQVWTPDILLYNSANEEFDSTLHTHVLVNSSGYCQWLPPGILKSTCQIDVRWFPFDTQKCDLKFGSWTYDGWLLDLRMLETDTSGYIANGEWDLVGVPGSQNKVFYECCREPYLDVTFAVTMRRRTLYYALNMLVPCLLLSAMTFLVFLLPADSGEKISLGITVLLSLTVFMLLVAEVMPATSDSIPLIGQYFATTMGMVGLSVVATVFVLQYHHHDPDGGCMPKWVQVVVLRWGAWLLRMRQPGEEPVGRPRCAPSLLSCSSDNSEGRRSTPTQQAPPVANGNLAYMAAPTGPLPSKPPEVPRPFLPSPEPQASTPEELLATPELGHILEELRYVAQCFRGRDAAQAACSQWKFAAAVVDRLCLVTFALVHIVCSIGILMAAPNFAEAITKDFL
ncbi:neuronal acetylcholine receptor subunit alpha-7-like isoform X2 [Hemicordylus capensis]|uniref:neuronal acetylcholine receptor subunit alpha-7-like isoform X2 n=1 Tax=Hemicordylus capensis TaxID=884348 RepID=UPI002304BAC7|nr:neuronal acetylcholine receptor subunit alpha-7-like isoform X2 [Hemicordylus capensis]XP_053133373.1 neuronal acetylcholine receptor subunit alpha-7-like isoform X2 [Hemicordylus capensis]XP_053133374.1 neuronal acetylcholine receptor subunit alpha-7-like isoform X2 [Hemicordylus capensis]